MKYVFILLLLSVSTFSQAFFENPKAKCTDFSNSFCQTVETTSDQRSQYPSETSEPKSVYKTPHGKTILKISLFLSIIFSIFLSLKIKEIEDLIPIFLLSCIAFIVTFFFLCSFDFIFFG